VSKNRLALLIGLTVVGCDLTGPGDREATAVVAGNGFSCALLGEHAYCWGLNDLGQLGRGTSADTAGPGLVKGDHHFRLLAASERTACGVTTSNEVFCWGYGTIFGSSNVYTVPAQITGTFPASIMSLGVGYGHGCVLATDGSATCFGTNAHAELGNATTQPQAGALGATTVIGGHVFSQVSVGAFHTCGLESGAVWCWGTNYTNSMGAGGTTAISTPRKLTLDFSVSRIEAGSADTCVLDGTSDAWCLGTNLTGQLGRGSGTATLASPTATKLAVFSSYTSVAVPRLNSTATHACGIASSGAAYCWGVADSAQTGQAPTETCIAGSGPLGCSPTPAAINSSLTFKQLALGRDHTCGVTTQGKVYCWGADSRRQLGGTIGHTTTTPTLIHF
jgi:alpha-tubulin suppressor-like RCC1 family protein